MKRQRGRNNGRKPHMPQRSQTFDSSGPDVRIRGNAYQVLEKYLALARDASAAGDRIAAENFYQHAEHYYRVISANGEHQRQQQQMHGQGHGHGYQGQPHQQQGQDPRQQAQPYDGQHQNGGYGPQGGHPHQQPQQTHAQNPGPGPGPATPPHGSDRQPS
jgi:hypothetical protein